MKWVAITEIVDKELGEIEDHAEQVVEVMGDAAGQTADEGQTLLPSRLALAN